MSAKSRVSSVASFLSTDSQRKLAELEAQEQIKKMEMAIQLEIEVKEEAIFNFEKEKTRAERALAKYADVDLEAMSDKEKSLYTSIMESIDDSKFEVSLLQEDIKNLHKKKEKRKLEILERQQLKVKKIDVIDEDEKNEWCSEETEQQKETSKDTVKNWVNSTSGNVEPPPPQQFPNQVHHFDQSKQCENVNVQVRNQTQPRNFGYDPRLYPPPPQQQTNMMGSHAYGMPNVSLQRNGGFGYGPPPPSNSQFVSSGGAIRMDGYHPPPVMNQTGYGPPTQTRSDIDEKMMALMEAQINLLSRSGTGGNREVVVKTSVDKDLPNFYGNPAQFNNFKSAYNRSTAKYNFDGDENMMRLQKALKGEARKKVSHLMANPLNLDKLLKTLEESYGRPEFVLDYLVEKVKTCDKIEVNKPSSLVAFGDTVEALVTNVCSYNKQDYMYNKQLTKELVEKLPGPLKTRWFEWRAEDETRETNLLCFSNWLELRVKAARLQLTPSMKPEDEDKESAGMRRTKRGPATAHVAVSDDGKKHCFDCDKGGHNTVDCRRFARKTNRDKWNFVKDKKLCFLCLRIGHRTVDCRSGTICTTDGCDKKHHPILHYTGGKKIKEAPPPQQSSSESDSEEEQKPSGSGTKSKSKKSSSDNTTTAGASVVEGTDGALPIIPVWLNGPKGTVKTYALLDTGASRSLIEEELAEELGLDGKEFQFSCRGFGGTVTKHRNAKKVDLNISGYFRGAKYAQIDDVITVEKIGIAPYSLDLREARRRWPCLRRIKGRSMKEVFPRIIVGSPHRHLTIPREILCSRLGGPVATRTILGWVLEGDLNGTGASTMYYIGGNAAELDITLHNLIKDSFRNEDFGIKPSPSRHSLEDKRALQIMEATTIKLDDRWETGLLWKHDDIALTDSYNDACKRLWATEKRMERDSAFRDAYTKKINEYLSKGFIRKLTPQEVELKTQRTFYIPHFGVTNPNKPGKFRLVFDAAAKTRGTSLNDCLLTGPDLLQPLTTVLWNFRRHNIVISGDIEDMFHRVKIRKEDQASQRFLWRDGDTSRDPDVYEMEVMIFGATSSPSCAIYVKNRNAEMLKLEFPEAYRAIVEDFYVDDNLTGAETEEEAIKLREDITHVNCQGGFHIKKWLSNSQIVMESIPKELRLDGARSISGESADYERVLGLWWEPNSDHFTFKTNFHKVNKEILDGKRPTKREICGLVMSLYDPLGFIGHYRVKGMIILQSVWNSGIGWDDEIPDEILENWLNWLGEINLITSVRIPRCYCFNMKNAMCVELHTFVDASKEAYAAVCYFRFVLEDRVETSLISSKVKVAPLKKLTVPKLELQAAVLGSKLAATISNEIKMNIDKKYFWSDSRTVLSWIRSQSARQPEFIANRIGAIQDSTNIIDWRWIPTALNVADDATRINKQTEFDEDARWFTGPMFLKLNADQWPSDKKLEEEEICVEYISCGDSFRIGLSSDRRGLKEGAEEMAIINMKKFSSYTRLLHAVSAVIRVSKLWLSKTRAKNKCNLNVPLYLEVDGTKICTATDADLEEAQLQLVKWMQKEEFMTGGVLRKDKKMKKLCPYFDECGVLRARGRIDNSNVAEATRRPIILPARHHLTELIVDCEHRKNAHTGQDTVLNNLRKTFWILNGRQAIRRCWARCNYCRIQRAKPIVPEMGVLPSCRLTSGTYAFTYTGVDYFGPMEVTVGRRHEKRWGVLFCCMVTRAIHLEIAHGLSTDETVLALSRFVDSRRRPHTIFSDNGTNFHGAIKELERAVKTEEYQKILEETGLKQMQWKFIPPAAAHMGGAWERLIQAVKKVLKVVLHDKFPRDTVLMTVFKSAENIVNSRPMTYLSSDADDPDPLTPNHFVKGGVDFGPSIPADVETRAKLFREKWKESQALANRFWEKWTVEYLPTLLRREKWTDEVEPLDVGDLVLIVDEQLPRNCWVKAVVTATFPGKDGHVRAVEVTTRSYSTKKKTTLKRPVTKLCPLGLRMEKSAVLTSDLGAGVKKPTVGKQRNE